MSETIARTAPVASRLQLWAEFLTLFFGVPVLMAIFIEEIQRNRALFSIVIGLAIVALVLLGRTPGWKFRDLWRGPVFSEWRIILGFWAISAAACSAFVFAIDPDLFLNFVLYRPGLWLMVMIAYPILSAFPQEIIYRSLFFERYGVLFPHAGMAIAVNGVVFGLGHLFYDQWLTIAMTAVGGAVMGWAYLRNRSTLLAWVIHSLAGQLVFTAGLGRYFYSGAIGTG